MEKNTTTATLRGLRIAPRKVRLVVDQIRGKKVNDAKKILARSTKHAARPIAKLLDSAVANAKHNNFLTESSLVISIITVDGGPTLHRWMPRAMGRATPLRKRTSHVKIELSGDVDEKAKKAKEKEQEAPKVEKATTEKPTEAAPKKNTKAAEPKKMATSGSKSAAKKATVRRAAGRKK